MKFQSISQKEGISRNFLIFFYIQIYFRARRDDLSRETVF